MAKARRAKARPARIVVPVVVALLAVGGVAAVGAHEGWFTGDGNTTAGASPSVLATAETARPTEGPTESSASPSDASSTPTTPSAAQEALDGCQDKLKAGDDVLAAAEVGVGHWSEHVQAQTDANSGKITVDEMDAIFKRTRLAGPDDVSAYKAAVKTFDKAPGSCEPSEDALPELQRQLATCWVRSETQASTLDAAQDAMEDWESHLAAMQRSRMGHVNDAQGVWLKAWRAAPPHIKAYDKATKKMAKAPTC